MNAVKCNQFEAYEKRITNMNNQSLKSGAQDIINLKTFKGSIGAIDGTYSIRPSLTDATLSLNQEDRSCDRMFSNYVKAHAHKLLVLTSHGYMSNKLILKVFIGVGSASDKTMWSVGKQELKEFLSDELGVHGDNAFITSYSVIVPYHSRDILYSNDADEKASFNSLHSQKRVCSEHGIKLMKYWAIIRGRSDFRLFEDEVLYERSVFVVQGLVNYLQLDCPSI
jgi:hypothetical protein